MNGNLVSVCAPEGCIVQTQSVSNESIDELPHLADENRENSDDIV